MDQLNNRRILLIDDTPSIHEDFRKILTPPEADDNGLDDLEAQPVSYTHLTLPTKA